MKHNDKARLPSLLPCPFCGGKAKVKKDTYWETFRVRCQNCFSMTPPTSTNRGARLFWNHRVGETKTKKAIAKAEGET